MNLMQPWGDAGDGGTSRTESENTGGCEMAVEETQKRGLHWGLKLLVALLLFMGLPLLAGGIYLMVLGGSWYYALAGAAYLYAAYELVHRRMRGVWICVAMLAVTAAWALWESGGFNFWAFEVRTIAPTVLAALGLLFAGKLPQGQGRSANTGPLALGGGVLMLGAIGLIAGMFFPQGVIRGDFKITPGTPSTANIAAGDDWPAGARTAEGIRHAPAQQITPQNVSQLQVAWTLPNAGDVNDPAKGLEEQNTPIYVDGRLFHCSPNNKITAVDGATGKVLWKFDPQAKSPFWNRCRAVGYFDPGPGDECGPRVMIGTIDNRLIAVRAADGKLCPSFGNGGTVDTSVGMGQITAGYVMHTSGPLVAGERIVMGAWIADGMTVGEPSGVVRAWNARTGELDWAWDLGRPDIDKLPPPGETYTRGTPNAWPPLTADVELGLVFLPLGNATPDFWAGERRPFDDKYNSSLVALDLATGKERWHFQTVHHDIWDYDLPAQPALIDFPDGKGGTTPAVLQTTKRGYIFVLDRRTGKPLVETVERKVPGGDGTATGERYSPTQPYPIGMASVGTDPLTEKVMWGMIPIDQMICRIYFKSRRYDGDFTAQSTKETLIFPGNFGGFNWGSVSVDPARNILIVNDSRMPETTHLIPRADFDPKAAEVPHGMFAPQLGTPFAQQLKEFMGPLGAPCLQPPMGTISGIDLATRKVVWQRPGGTMRDISFGKIQPHVPFYVGLPTLGGPLTTGSGLTFFAGTQDYYLRAYDTETGDELWKGRLPVGSQGTPMTYVDKASGRQFVVVVAGGARDNPNGREDWIIAYALPQKAKDAGR